MYVLDTSAIIDIFENNSVGKLIAGYIKDEPFVVSALTLYELNKKNDPSAKLLYFIRALEIIPFGERAATEAGLIFKRMREKGKPINEIDVLIASTALSRDGELIASDSDFSVLTSVSNLKLRFFDKRIHK